MQTLDKLLKCHPEYIDIVIKAFKIYTNKNDIELEDALSDITTIPLDALHKKHKKYKKSMTPYANINPPASSYSYFMKEQYKITKAEMKKDNPTLSEVSKEVSKKWSKLDNKGKKKYEILSKEDKKRYHNEKIDIDNKMDVNIINKPKRPQSAFFFFLADVRPEIKKESPGIKTVDIAKEGKIRWNKLKTNTKNKYNKISQLDKDRYAKEKEIYLSEINKQ